MKAFLIYQHLRNQDGEQYLELQPNAWMKELCGDASLDPKTFIVRFTSTVCTQYKLWCADQIQDLP